MSRDEITLMVEDFWRTFIPVAFNGDQKTAALIVERFQKQIETMAAMLPDEERILFDQFVDADREKLFHEYNQNPQALKLRLGLVEETSKQFDGGSRSHAGLGHVVVNTAVRATVWESVRAIFRAFRG